MIPKVIHYCWFGYGKLPVLAEKCIASWKKYLPDYEIKEWNEQNYPIESQCDYVKEAYDAKKWAFVSDYARFDILYKYGGVYFDTDVEVIKSLDDILERGAFIGGEPMEDSNSLSDCFASNPGLGMSAAPGLGIYKEMLDSYHASHFLNRDGTYNKMTVVTRMTDILKRHGFKTDKVETQKVEGIFVYPPEYFSPLVYGTGELRVTENTRTIHHYMASWKTPEEEKMKAIDLQLEKKLGKKVGRNFAKIVNVPLRIKMKVKQYGVAGTVQLVYRHYSKKEK